MKIFRLKKRHTLPISISKAWEFFSNPRNLGDITPPELALKIKRTPQARIYNGMIIEYSLKPLLGISMDWITEIKHIQEPYMFVDEQRIGPYKFWYHQHKFKSIGKGVEIEDIVYYALPLNFLAAFVNRIFIEKKLDSIFQYRKAIINQKLCFKEITDHAS